MIENIYEQSIVNDNDAKTQTKYFFLGGISIIFFCVAFFSLIGFTGGTQVEWSMLLITVPTIALGVFFWRKKDEAYLEYEYAYTCGDLEIAKIINQKRRKTLCKFACSDIETIGKITASNYSRYASMPNAKKIYATFKKKGGDNVYFAFYTGKKGKVVLHFEPDEELLKFIKKHLRVQFSI